MAKKSPYIEPSLVKKIVKAKASGARDPIKTWSRRSTIHPEMVGLTFEVHNGRRFEKVYVNESMVGHKLGEFALTRRFGGHKKGGKKDDE
tara:strand:+ start:559 stop:828 length:270 start_codon:yes stop_codon:yes gene_type:complete